MSLTVASEVHDAHTRLTFTREGRPLSFRALFESLSNGDGLPAYVAALAAVPFDAYAWEHPALSEETIDHTAELVCVAAPRLARSVADPTPFAAHFDGSSVVRFDNLGGDARLIAPCPTGEPEAHAHLARFVREGEPDRVHAFFRAVARLVLEDTGPAPRWLSTAGLGVAWLHARWDTRPKYIRHRAYRSG